MAGGMAPPCRRVGPTSKHGRGLASEQADRHSWPCRGCLAPGSVGPLDLSHSHPGKLHSFGEMKSSFVQPHIHSHLRVL